ncbi:serine--tRNA ligase [Parasphingorhabdus sp. DH2-15]|uniref:serine--tRNA ligase n=1 Tax=Parasphingorhabdus sp. DH2-15 TaxID=3444112 RepID=UPI003F687308
MHDIKIIRDEPEAFDAALALRGLEPLASKIQALDEDQRRLTTELQAMQARRNEASKAIGMAMGKGDKALAESLKSEVSDIKNTMPQLEEQQRAAAEQLALVMNALPNLPLPEIPHGEDEDDNVELNRWGTPRTFDFAPKDHSELGPALGMDFETGAKISGARFTFLRAGMARLQRAIGQFMLDKQTVENGYTECAPPLLVRDHAAFGTGQLPKFAEDLFRTTDGRCLISTSEISLANSVREQILESQQLPIRITALTPCFRSEAGSAGRDTKGYIRQHQFEKVEMITIARPDQDDEEFQHMHASAESVLQALELPYRNMMLCTGDMGASVRKTIDLEVWLPGQETYREISSVSTCGTYQARRMNTRYRPESDKDGAKKPTEFVHTLNGSGLAVGRTLVAVVENYQNADGSVTIPDALLPYMGGMAKLMPAQ